MAPTRSNVRYGGRGPGLQSSYAAALSADAFLSLGSMEGLYEPIVATGRARTVAAPATKSLLPGYAFAAGIAVLATLIHDLPIAPFTVTGEGAARHPISAAIIAIILGLAMRNLISLPTALAAGCKHVVKKCIPIAIVMMGAGLNMGLLADIGVTALLITIVCIGVAIGASYYVGKMLGMNWKTAMLLGTGTAICGNSAIVAVAPLIDAEDDDLVLSIGAVNLFGILAMLAWPVAGGMLSLGEEQFGVWAGTSIHAVPQVVAAGFAYGTAAGTLATAVKLVRVTLLAPLVCVLAILYARQHADDAAGEGKLTVRYARLVPWFVWGFVAFAVLNSLHLLPTLHFPGGSPFFGGEPLSVTFAAVMKKAGGILLTLAMAAIGLEINVRTLSGVGATAVKAGLLSTLSLGVVSLLLILLLI